MYLKSVYLHGFKSFARATDLKFGRELTAIVGPNGSGKSNVLDAIRWALGEQSLKTIRGKKSTDVLFSGSASKARASVAEVTLTLDNHDHVLPVDYEEVTITRRIYRDGASDYLIGHQPVRLQDITLLLAQANFGQKSYSIVSQGMVDHVINATPSERLQFFIEATGVRQYQMRRDDAVNKLDLTAANLQEAGSRLTELTPILNSLTRQVKRLQKREQLVQELRQWQRSYYWHRARRSQEEKIIIYRRLQEATAKQLRQRGAVEQCRTELTALNAGTRRTELFARLQSDHQAALAKRDELLRSLAELKGRQAGQLTSQGQGNLAWLQEQQEQLKAALATQEKKLTAAASHQHHLQTELLAITEQYQQAEQALTQAEQALNEIITAANQPSLTSLTAVTKAVAAKLRHLIQNLKKQETNLNELVPQLEILAAELDQTAAATATASPQAIQQTFQQTRRIRDDLLAAVNRQELAAELTDQEIKSLTAEIDAAQATLKQLEQKRQPTATPLAAMETKLQQAEQLVQTAAAQLTGAHEQAQQLEQQRSQTQAKLQTATEQLAKVDAEVAEIQVAIARWQALAEDLTAEVTRELHQELSDLANDLKLQEQDQGGSANWIEKIQHLKDQVAQIGGIDPEIMAEYEQVKQRHEFLTSQTTDLTAALQQLQQVIKELDKIIGQQFHANFKRINQEFMHFFKTLFGGGKASLYLETLADRAAPLEAGPADEEPMPEKVSAAAAPAKLKLQTSPLSNIGIAIDACPPDKKITAVQALSGGERALMSTALLCAIVACNPAPFVIMDEVDAALDEANAERLANIFQELNKKTQIIVITHNRVIMQHADVLYGVTMDSDGISRVLSLSLKDAEKLG